MQPKRVKVCEFCNKEYGPSTPKRAKDRSAYTRVWSKSRFCSRKCAARWKGALKTAKWNAASGIRRTPADSLILIKKCTRCGDLFGPKYQFTAQAGAGRQGFAHQTWCSISCRNKGLDYGKRRVKSLELDGVECPVCGKRFIPKSGANATGLLQKFCSRFCRLQDMRDSAVPTMTKACVVCGDTFSNRRNTGKLVPNFDERTTCSHRCHGQQIIRSRPVRRCIHCGDNFQPTPSSVVVYCSHKCAGLAKRQTVPKQNAEWNADNYRRYARRMISADTSCADCGVRPDRARHPVHHIDQDPRNNSIANLVALCGSCHSKRHQAFTQKARKFYMEHISTIC